MISNLKPGDSQSDAAWAWFVERYKPLIAGLLRRKVDAGRAEEAVSEFWGYLFSSRALERADRTRRFRSYLFGIVDRFARKWQRGGRPVPGSLEDETPDREARGVGTEEMSMWTAHLLALGLRELREAHPDQARALCWFYGIDEGNGSNTGTKLGATAIATQLGKSVANVHQMLTRGRKHLRDSIEREVRESVMDPQAFEEELRLLASGVESMSPGLMVW